MGVVRMPQLGGCVCGAVRYTLNATPLLVYACHCHDCQTRSGSAFALTVVVHTADLSLTGVVERVHMTTPSGRDLEHSLCPECRVRLLVCAVAAPDFASLRAGTLDNASWAVPIAQMYAESAIPWAVMPDVRQVPPEAFDFVALAADWRATAPRFERSLAHPGADGAAHV